MGYLIEVTPAGAILGPFRVYPGRPFGAWFEVLALNGATSVSLTTEKGEDGETWTVAEVEPAILASERHVVYVAEPGRYARMLVSVTAPGGWSGSVACSWDASKEEWDIAIADAAANEEAAQVEAAVADLRKRLGIDTYLASARSADAFLPPGTG